MKHIAYQRMFSIGITNINWKHSTAFVNLTPEATFEERYVADWDYNSYTYYIVNGVTSVTLTYEFDGMLLNTTSFYLSWNDISTTDYMRIQYSSDGVSWNTLLPVEVFGDATLSVSDITPTTATNGKMVATVPNSGYKYFRIMFIDTSTFSNADLKINHFIPFADCTVHSPNYDLNLKQYIYDQKSDVSYDGTTFLSSFNTNSNQDITLNWNVCNPAEKLQLDNLIYSINYDGHILIYDDEDFTDFNYLTLFEGDLTYTESNNYLFDFTINLKGI